MWTNLAYCARAGRTSGRCVGPWSACGAFPGRSTADLFESTFRAIDRTTEPRLAVVATPPRRRLRPLDASLGPLVRRFLVEHEFHLISYSVGMVASFFLFTGVLMGLRPLVALTAGASPKQATIWITTREADAMGVDLEPRLAAVAYTIPKGLRAGGLPQFAAVSQVSGSDLIVLADVSADGRASNVEVLGGTADPHVVAARDRAQPRLRSRARHFGSARRVACRFSAPASRRDWLKAFAGVTAGEGDRRVDILHSRV